MICEQLSLIRLSRNKNAERLFREKMNAFWLRMRSWRFSIVTTFWSTQIKVWERGKVRISREMKIFSVPVYFRDPKLSLTPIHIDWHFLERVPGPPKEILIIAGEIKTCTILRLDGSMNCPRLGPLYFGQFQPSPRNRKLKVLIFVTYHTGRKVFLEWNVEVCPEKKWEEFYFPQWYSKIKVFSIQKFRFSACVCWAAHFNGHCRQRHLVYEKHNFLFLLLCTE